MALNSTDIANLFDFAKFGGAPFELLRGGSAPRHCIFTAFARLPDTVLALAPDISDTFFRGNTGVGTPTISRDTKGGVLLTTSAADNDAAVLTGIADTMARPAITLTNEVIFQARVNMATITHVLAVIGMGQAPSATTPGVTTASSGTDSAEFVFDPDADLTTGLAAGVLGNWLIRYRAASGTVTYASTGVPVVAATDYDLMICITPELKPQFRINGEVVYVGPALTATTQICQAAVKATSASARTLAIRFAKVGANFA